MFLMQSQQREGEQSLEGLVEHSHNVLRCSACRRDLLDVVVVRPDVDGVFRFRAECPFCPPDPKGRPRRSFPVDVKGGVLVGLCGDEAVNYDGDEFLDDDGDGIEVSTLLKTSRRKAT